MKKFFLGLIVFSLSIISFSYGVDFSQFNKGSSITVRSNTPGQGSCSGFCCFSSSSSSFSYRTAVMFNNEIQILPQSVDVDSLGCVFYSGDFTLTTTNSAITLYQYNFVGSLPSTSCPTCFGPNVNINKIECDGGDCSYLDNQLMYTQTGTFVFINLGTGVNFDSYHVGGNGNVYYNFSSDELICPVYTGNEVSTGENWSALFINGIQHESSPLINVNIADWVVWDYSINEDSFDLDIGSGYDQDYIDGVIDVQSYRPTSEDFTQTFVGGLILFTPYVVILLFVILIWKLIKGIFKTK